jgi:glycosyltransferase involved in cell wall biosynthesis
MRLAYLHYLVEGDTGRHHVRQFAEGARRLGHEIEVCPMNLAPDDGPGSSAAGAGLASRGRAVLKRHLGRYLHEPKEILWNPLYVRAETALLRRLRPDVLLVRDHTLTASPVITARRLGLPLVFEVNAPTEEGSLFLDEYLHLPFVSRWIDAWKLRRADGVAVVSSTLKRMLVESVGLAEDRVVVAPNGADVDRFRPDLPPDPILARAGDGSPVLGFVGSFRRWHGTELLARTILEVGRARPHVRALLVGDGPEAGAIREAVRPLGNRVVMTGRVEHARIPALTAAFDIGLLPETLFYGSPLKVVEWMAAGRAVVAPGYPALSDLVEDGVHALLFPPGDAAALAGAVLRLVDDAALRNRLGQAAAARARAHLTWTDNARRVLGACEAALRRRDPRPRPAA